MTEKTVSKMGKALCAGIASAVVFASFADCRELKAQNMSLLFPQFIIGVSVENKDDSEDRVRIEEKDVKTEYSFKIAELFKRIFG